ncbi:hypothetical protein FANTH_12267 [Fusarium anthophilum]|uniref:Rhodopsin domain-containing protein n=1 Tax=Fusarium anthophilum TaxID=48485 RepID=A0A8H4YUR9_9HYPO|nr:hypothetical protein FANTH_12267 [Fusarium anthophilum]
MPMGGDGPWAIAVMWALTVVVFIFVLLRLYTRVFVVESLGIDDHVYNVAFVFLLLYTIFTTVSAHYGFGQDIADILARDPNDLPFAILFEAIGQTFAVVGMAVAKWSLGLLLLRIVGERWHKIAIWVSMGCLAGASVSTCFVFWLQCTPPKHLWDRRVPGKCTVNSTPISMILCIFCVIVDFFFAGFPWLFIWSLRMNKQKRVVILCSLSLGVIAGACGIKRTMEVPELSSSNYPKDTVGLIVWSAAEIAVTMICIGIPTCRPLYNRYLDRWTSRDGSKYREHSAGRPYPLQTIGGSTLNPNTPDKNNGISEDYDEEEHKGSIAGRGPFTRTRVYSKGVDRLREDDQSDEEILGPDFRRD